MDIQLYKKYLLLSILLLLPTIPAYGNCSIKSLTTSIFGTVANPSNTAMQNVFFFKQNAFPINITYDATVYCSGSSTLDILNLNDNNGFNSAFTRETKIMLNELEPTRYDGRSNLIIKTSQGDVIQSIADIFSRATSNTGIYSNSTTTTYTIRFTIPSLMLYPTSNKSANTTYETGRSFFSICPTNQYKGCVRFSLAMYLTGISDDNCLAPAFTTSIDKPVINFGNIDKTDIQAGKKFHDNFRITIRNRFIRL